MRLLTTLGASLAALALGAGNALAAPAGSGPIEWTESWDAAAKAAKAKGSVIFVYVHRRQPS